MKIDSELCHVDSNKIIVRLTASANNVSLGSALGEGSNVREAEDSALSELLRRIERTELDLKQNEVSTKKSNKTIKELGQHRQAKQDLSLIHI